MLISYIATHLLALLFKYCLFASEVLGEVVSVQIFSTQAAIDHKSSLIRYRRRICRSFDFNGRFLDSLTRLHLYLLFDLLSFLEGKGLCVWSCPTFSSLILLASIPGNIWTFPRAGLRTIDSSLDGYYGVSFLYCLIFLVRAIGTNHTERMTWSCNLLQIGISIDYNVSCVFWYTVR